MVQDLSRRRDFPEVREWAYQVHDKFLKEEMPFIPLWQLDPLAAVHADVITPSPTRRSTRCWCSRTWSGGRCGGIRPRLFSPPRRRRDSW